MLVAQSSCIAKTCTKTGGDCLRHESSGAAGLSPTWLMNFVPDFLLCERRNLSKGGSHSGRSNACTKD
jgi:hypothetical protein